MIDSYTYNHNNVDFRMFSSTKIVEYKTMQRACLAEMTSGKHKFPHGVKEIFLLKLDIWFRYLLQMEKQFIDVHKKILDKESIDGLIRLCDRTYKKYTHIMEDDKNKEYFNQDIYLKWSKVHDPLYYFLLDFIKSLEGMDPINAFGSISNMVIMILNTTLYELFEIVALENIYSTHTNEDTKFICFTDICKYYAEFYGGEKVCISVHRLIMYMDIYGIDSIYIKDFSMYGLNEQYMNKIEDLGIKIDFKRSLLINK